MSIRIMEAHQMPVDIFIVESPLQFINAMEAKYQISSGAYCVLIVLQGVSDKNLEQIKLLIDEREWQETHILNCTNNKWKYRRSTRLLNEIIDAHKVVNTVFIGEYRSILMRHVINKCKPEKKFLLDDGNYSLYAQKKILANCGERSTYGLIKKVFIKMLRLQDEDIFNIDFFSIYELNLDSNTKTRFKRNEYSLVRSLLSAKESSDYILFIGNNSSEMGVISEEYYFKALKRVKQYYANSPIKYVPHRRENANKILRIKEELQFEIFELNKPVELFILENKSLPNCVASLFSSALDNCHYILGSRLKINSFKVPQNEILSEEDKALLKLVYEVYTSYGSNFEIIEL